MPANRIEAAEAQQQEQSVTITAFSRQGFPTPVGEAHVTSSIKQDGLSEHSSGHSADLDLAEALHTDSNNLGHADSLGLLADVGLDASRIPEPGATTVGQIPPASPDAGTSSISSVESISCQLAFIAYHAST